MTQTDWAKVFSAPTPPSSAQPAEGVGRLARWLWVRITGWEDWLTFAIVFFTFLGATQSVQAAGWVEDMPSLVLVGFLGLLCGFVFARAALPQVLLHPLALVVGATVVLWQLLGPLPGDGWVGKWETFYGRMEHWVEIAGSGGISNDTLPFILLVVALTWLCAYFFAWSVFRWQNPWLGLLPAGTALFVNFTFTDQFTFLAVLYIGGALLLIMRLSLTRKLQNWRQEEVPHPRFLSLSTAHLSGWAVLGLLVMAWLMPTSAGARPLDNVWAYLAQPFDAVAEDTIRLIGPIKTTKALPIHGFKSVLPFQGGIKLSNRPVASVQVDNGIAVAQYPFLRGAIYDEYLSAGWKAGDRKETPRPPLILEEMQAVDLEAHELVLARIQVADSDVAKQFMFSVGDPLGADVPAKGESVQDVVYHVEVPAEGVCLVGPLSRSRERPGESQEELQQLQEAAEILCARLGEGSAALADEDIFALLPEGLAGVNVERERSRVRQVDAVWTGSQPGLDLLRPEQQFRRGDTYTVAGLVPVLSAEELRVPEQRSSYPYEIRSRYLQLPDELPARVRELAVQIAGDEASAYDKAKAIEYYLRLIPVEYEILDVPPGADAVDFFLFEAQQGYFDYHASAMVVLLRAVDVPARLAIGYQLDPDAFDRESRQYNLMEAHAYAWPEVYFAGVGWVPFNPTPDRPAVVRPGDFTGGGWFSGDPSMWELPLGLKDLIGPSTGPAVPSADTPGADGGAGDYRVLLWALAGLLAAAIVLGLGARLAWERSLAGLPYPQRLWEQTLRLATWARLGPQPHQTPREYAGELHERLPDLEGMDTLAEAYNRSRFGQKPPDETQGADLRDAWKHVRGRLWRRVLFWR
jgi:transglutaminase-like putative cysteine protease